MGSQPLAAVHVPGHCANFVDHLLVERVRNTGVHGLERLSSGWRLCCGASLREADQTRFLCCGTTVRCAGCECFWDRADAIAAGVANHWPLGFLGAGQVRALPSRTTEIFKILIFNKLNIFIFLQFFHETA